MSSDDETDPPSIANTLAAPLGLYVPIEDSINALPWRVFDDERSRLPAFDDTFAEYLADEYSIDDEGLKYLSSGLSKLLVKDLRVMSAGNVKARMKKGSQKARKVYDVIDRAESLFFEAYDDAEYFHISDMISRSDVEPDPDRLADKIQAVLLKIGDLKQYLGDAIRDGHIVLGAAPDRRLVRDPRREVVCNYIFSFWKGLERNVSYTTNTVTYEREGRLVKFTNDIIGHLTDPATPVKQSTLRLAIRKFQNSRGFVQG